MRWIFAVFSGTTASVAFLMILVLELKLIEAQLTRSTCMGYHCSLISVLRTIAAPAAIGRDGVLCVPLPPMQM